MTDNQASVCQLAWPKSPHMLLNAAARAFGLSCRLSELHSLYESCQKGFNLFSILCWVPPEVLDMCTVLKFPGEDGYSSLGLRSSISFVDICHEAVSRVHMLDWWECSAYAASLLAGHHSDCDMERGPLLISGLEVVPPAAV